MAAAVAARAKLERLLAAPAPFADDDGSISPEVRKALEAVDLPRHQYLDELWAALVGGRLIVPVAAHALPGRLEGSLAQSAGLQHGPSADGAPQVPAHEVHTADACQDAATLAVSLPDGHIALPVFTSAEAMSRWRSDVRPVPVSPERAAQVACLSTDQLWVLDPGSREPASAAPRRRGPGRGRGVGALMAQRAGSGRVARPAPGGRRSHRCGLRIR